MSANKLSKDNNIKRYGYLCTSKRSSVINL